MIANGTKFGRYEIHSLLGAGGMGEFISRGTATQTRVPNTCCAASDWPHEFLIKAWLYCVTGEGGAS